MSQFAFIKAEWPAVYTQAVKAEDYALNDPRAACFQARFALEQIMYWLYDSEQNLRRPYESTLSAMIGEPSFKRLAGGISQKAYLIKNNGNKAVHSAAKVPELKAISSVRELHHIAYWLARNYARSGPPPNVQFKAESLPRHAKVTPQKLAVLQQAAGKWQEQVEARKLAEVRLTQTEFEARAAQDEIDRLKAEIAAIKTANNKTEDRHDYNEAQTRTDLIDVLLEEAGWDPYGPNVAEYEVQGMPNNQGVGYVDYVLWGQNGKPLAVVEAKRSKKDLKVGERQAELYADCLEKKFGQRPIIFCTNGYEHEIWDDSYYPPRPIAGFLKHDELLTLVNRRSSRKPTGQIKINPEISGRYYQERAIRRICETFEVDKQRKALLVMATGSGKTRTSISLVDMLMKAGWVKRVLFLADRTALVKQAADAFKEHLPSSSPVNLLKEKDAVGRVYLSTYPTMMNLINSARDDSGKLVTFGPGHFDLIIVDEAHRSIYNRFGAIFDYFDSLLVGLTATPKDEIDRDTYGLFGLQRGVPTDAYDLEDAVSDGFLVPPKAMSVPLNIVRSGLKYDDLPDEEKEHWDSLEWGEGEPPPDEISAAEINKRLFNTDTVDKVLKNLMENGVKVDNGEKLGKTIVFAKNNKHAAFIKERFDANYPHLEAGHFARKIDYTVNYAQTLIDDFTVPEKMPQIAISVDMLDTGIDVPDVVNLVFFKVVRSKTKFWQMIGRGTRLQPDLFGPDNPKTHFVVFDYCQNIEYFGENLDAAESSSAKSLSQSLFLARMDILEAMDKGVQGEFSEDEQEGFDTEGAGALDLRNDIADHLHGEVSEMPLENFIVRPKLKYVESFLKRDDWNELTLDDQQALRDHISDLPTARIDNDIDAKRFDLLVLRAQAAVLNDSVAIENYRKKITDIAAALEIKDVPVVKKELELILEIQSEAYWEGVTAEILEVARRKLRSLVRLIGKVARKTVYSDFEDIIGDAVEVDILEGQQAFDKARFRPKARHFLKDHLDNLAVHKIHTNVPVTETDLSELERILGEQSLYGEAEAKHIETNGGLASFVRKLVGLDKSAARDAFASFIRDNELNGDQIEFVDMIINALSINGVVSPAQLYEQPFTLLNDRGLSGLFDAEDSAIIVSLIKDLNAQIAA